MFYTVYIGLVLLNFSVGKVSADCSTGCYDPWRGDGWCDSACDNAACNYDDGDCGSNPQCSMWCDNSQVGDGTCDFWCNVSSCNYDDGDCTNDDNGDDTSGGGLLDDDIWTGECSLSSCPGVHGGHCGALATKTDKWCEMGGTDVCCTENSGECCVANGGAIAGIIIGIIAVIGICCYYCCNCNKDKDKDNNKDYGEPPHCCFKFWCPTCAVCSHQGCDEPCDVILSLWLGWFFTLCCWHPKTKTYIAPPNIYVVTSNNEGNIEIPATAQIQQPPVYQQLPPIYQQQPPSYVVNTDSKEESL